MALATLLRGCISGAVPTPPTIEVREMQENHRHLNEGPAHGEMFYPSLRRYRVHWSTCHMWQIDADRPCPLAG